jgi:GDP-mannose 6-dehydrogenase
MNISIFGLGYVGAVSAGCLAEAGHTVIGVDPNRSKVDLINQGQTPIIEQGIGDLIRRNVEAGRLRGTTSSEDALAGSELSLVCVGTPSRGNGSLDVTYVRRVCEEIARELRNHDGYHVVVVRSTMLPGTVNGVVVPTLEEHSGRKAGENFGVCINPEFLREGTAVYDFHHPPKTVIGEFDSRSGDVLASVYKDIEAPLIRTSIETAEMVKYTDNAWHALKIGFANEIGTICKGVGIDSHQVMNIFCQDLKLNISTAYLKPGFAFGGSCLPKDLRALTYKARSLDVEVPILENILRSNRRQIERALGMVLNGDAKKVGSWGSASRPARTTFARVRLSRSSSGSSARGTTCGSMIAT